MKKYILIVVCLVMVVQAMAQRKWVRVSGGVKGGGNASVGAGSHSLWFLHDPAIFASDEIIVGQTQSTFHFPPIAYGGFVNVSLGQFAGIQIEGLHSFNGFEYQFDNFMIEKFSFFEVPILAKFNINGFSVYGGYQFNTLMYSEKKIEAYVNDGFAIMPYDKWIDTSDAHVKQTSSLVVGVDYTIQLGFGVYARYVHGLDNQINFNDPNTIYRAGDEIKFSSVQFGLSYALGAKPLKKGEWKGRNVSKQ